MIKTISFRADPEALLLLEELKQEMQLLYGVSVSNSDIIRKALKELKTELDYGYSGQAHSDHKEQGVEK